MAILVTGGAGYIGAHTLVSLLEASQNIVVYDNLINSSETSLKRVKPLPENLLILLMLIFEIRQR